VGLREALDLGLELGDSLPGDPELQPVLGKRRRGELDPLDAPRALAVEDQVPGARRRLDEVGVEEALAQVVGFPGALGRAAARLEPPSLLHEGGQLAETDAARASGKGQGVGRGGELGGGDATLEPAVHEDVERPGQGSEDREED